MGKKSWKKRIAELEAGALKVTVDERHALPAWASSYLLQNDKEFLTDGEIAMVDDFERKAMESVRGKYRKFCYTWNIDWDKNSYETDKPAFGEGTQLCYDVWLEITVYKPEVNVIKPEDDA